jgi:CheY-like chemotaxis protein
LLTTKNDLVSTATSNQRILYIDDDSDDCLFLSESFAAAGNNTNLICASDADQAINYLNSIHNEPLPSLIILDLNMPKRDGRQTLSYIKSQPNLAGIPVVILSTSENIIDIEVCKRLGAASYLQKPFHIDGYKEIVNICLPLMKSE